MLIQVILAKFQSISTLFEQWFHSAHKRNLGFDWLTWLKELRRKWVSAIVTSNNEVYST